MTDDGGSDYAVLCSALVLSALADVLVVPFGLLRQRGIDYGIAHRRSPATHQERTAALLAWRWLRGAEALVTFQEACRVAGIRPSRVLNAAETLDTEARPVVDNGVLNSNHHNVHGFLMT